MKTDKLVQAFATFLTLLLVVNKGQWKFFILGSILPSFIFPCFSVLAFKLQCLLHLNTSISSMKWPSFRNRLNYVLGLIHRREKNDIFKIKLRVFLIAIFSKIVCFFLSCRWGLNELKKSLVWNLQSHKEKWLGMEMHWMQCRIRNCRNCPRQTWSE